MKVLIACECSGVVRRAFRALGHDAWSCDLKDAEDGSQHHIKTDFRSAIQESWDFVGYHYECRVMANSGVRWLHTKPGRRAELDEAAAIFNITLRDTRPGYSENSIMHKYAKARIDREQDQVIQPHWFGVPKFKGTCIWVRQIPPLKRTHWMALPKRGTKEYTEWSSVHRAPPGPARATNRARTELLVGEAMATQWSAVQ